MPWIVRKLIVPYIFARKYSGYVKILLFMLMFLGLIIQVLEVLSVQDVLISALRCLQYDTHVLVPRIREVVIMWFRDAACWHAEHPSFVSESYYALSCYLFLFNKKIKTLLKMSLLTRLFQKVRSHVIDVTEIEIFLKQKNDEDYETVLSSLALDIQNRQVKLSEIRLRERRSTLLVTLYTLAGWVAYVSLWYMNILPNFSGRAGSSRFERAVKGFPVTSGPILCVLVRSSTWRNPEPTSYSVLFVRRIVQIWYKRKGDAEGVYNQHTFFDACW